MSGVMTFTPIYAQLRHLTAISGFFFVAAIAGVVIRPIVGRTFDQRGPRLILMISKGLLLMGGILIAVVTSNWLLIVAGIYYGVADRAIYPTFQAWLFKVTTLDNRDTATGMFLNAYDLGMGLGAVSLGWLVEGVTYQGMFWVLALVALGYIGVALRASRSANQLG